MENAAPAKNSRQAERAKESPSQSAASNSRAAAVPEGISANPAHLSGARSHGSLSDMARQVISDHQESSPLPAAIKTQAEGALGTNLGTINLHHGPQAARVTHALGARAAQVGPDIFVRPDLYKPGSASGRALIGHELVHAAQWANNGQSGRSVSQPGQSSEQEARRLGPGVQ